MPCGWMHLCSAEPNGSFGGSPERGDPLPLDGMVYTSWLLRSYYTQIHRYCMTTLFRQRCQTLAVTAPTVSCGSPEGGDGAPEERSVLDLPHGDGGVVGAHRGLREDAGGGQQVQGGGQHLIGDGQEVASDGAGGCRGGVNKRSTRISAAHSSGEVTADGPGGCMNGRI
jgi:hypothetical protein